MDSNGNMMSLLKYARQIANEDSSIYEYLIKAVDDKNSQGDFLKKAETAIIARKDCILAFRFARAIKNADIKALQKVIIDKKDAFYAFCFARDIEGADILALQKVVTDTRDPVQANRFADYVKGADLMPLYKVILNSNDEKQLNLFIKNHEDFMFYIENKYKEL